MCFYGKMKMGAQDTLSGNRGFIERAWSKSTFRDTKILPERGFDSTGPIETRFGEKLAETIENVVSLCQAEYKPLSGGF